MVDHHLLLDIEKDATKEEIEAAWKKLAKKHHPDKNPDNPFAADNFSKLTAARDAMIDRLDNPGLEEVNIEFTTPLFTNVLGATLKLYDEEVKLPAGTLPGSGYSVNLSNGKTVNLTVVYRDDQEYRVEGNHLRLGLIVKQEAIDAGKVIEFPDHSKLFTNRIRIDKDTKTGDVVWYEGMGLRNNNGPWGNLGIDVTIIPRKPPPNKIRFAIMVIVVIIGYLYFTQGGV